MFIHNEIRKNLSLFSDICKNHGIKSLYAFGSSVTEQFNPQRSDIDLLVEMEDMDPLEKGEKLLSLWDKLRFLSKKSRSTDSEKFKKSISFREYR